MQSESSKSPFTKSSLITRKSLAAAFDVTTRTIIRWEKSPALNFPKSIAINGKRYWDAAEIEAWKAARFRAAIAAINSAA